MNIYIKLSWKDHVMLISAEISRGMGIIIKARKNSLQDDFIDTFTDLSIRIPYIVIRCGVILTRPTFKS